MQSALLTLVLIVMTKYSRNIYERNICDLCIIGLAFQEVQVLSFLTRKVSKSKDLVNYNNCVYFRYY